MNELAVSQSLSPVVISSKMPRECDRPQKVAQLAQNPCVYPSNSRLQPSPRRASQKPP